MLHQQVTDPHRLGVIRIASLSPVLRVAPRQLERALADQQLRIAVQAAREEVVEAPRGLLLPAETALPGLFHLQVQATVSPWKLLVEVEWLWVWEEGASFYQVWRR
jgi:hypothetical protein